MWHRYQASSISFQDILALAGGFSTQTGAPKDSAVRLATPFCESAQYDVLTYLRYNITSDSWEDLNQKLDVGRAYATAIAVPDDLADCRRGAADDNEDIGGALIEDAYDEYLRSAWVETFPMHSRSI